MNNVALWSLIFGLALISCSEQTSSGDAIDASGAPKTDSLRYEDERHFGRMRQLTYGGDNAEAYWSFGNDKLVFQANNPSWSTGCDQIFTLNLYEDYTPTSEQPDQISSGLGRTTCAYFMPGDSSVVFASKHLADSNHPA